jgi:uncharacterized membrane protein (DUF106 family)
MEEYLLKEYDKNDFVLLVEPKEEQQSFEIKSTEWLYNNGEKVIATIFVIIIVFFMWLLRKIDNN